MPFKTIRNRKGMSLIEVLVAAGLMMIVATGLISVTTSMNKEQNNQTRISTLRELKTRIQFLISDQNTWNSTLAQNFTAGNALAVCIRNKTSCSSAGITDLKLYDSSGAVFFDPPTFGTDPVAAGSKGFTDKGAPCSTFNGAVGAGDDKCPISYKIVWEPICPPSGTCKNPLIRVTARLLFNPASPTTAFSLGNADHTTAWTDDSVATNTGKYDVFIKRSASTVNKAFMITISRTGTAGVADGPGGGVCKQDPVWGDRGDSTNQAPAVTGGAFDPPWVEGANDDPFDLVSVAANGTITIQPGTYSCKITAIAWAVASFSIRLSQITGGVGTVVNGSVGSSFADTVTTAQSTVNSSPTFSISTPSDFKVQQSCQWPNYVLPAARKYNLGMPTAPYNLATTMASMTCTQTN